MKTLAHRLLPTVTALALTTTSAAAAVDVFARASVPGGWVGPVLDDGARLDGRFFGQATSEDDPAFAVLRFHDGMLWLQGTAAPRVAADAVEIISFAGGDGPLGGGLDGEAGSAFVHVPGHGWHHPITFARTYQSPVVFAQLATIHGDQPMMVRVENVTPTGADLVFDEPAYYDGSHVGETVHYVVLEAGVHPLDDGRVLEVGTFTRTTDDRGYDRNPAITLQDPLYGEPVVVTTLQSMDRPGMGHLRIRKTGTGTDMYTGFETRFAHEDDGSLWSGPSVGYTVGYMALGRPWIAQPGRLELYDYRGVLGGYDFSVLPRGACIDLAGADVDGFSGGIRAAAHRGTLELIAYRGRDCTQPHDHLGWTDSGEMEDVGPPGDGDIRSVRVGWAERAFVERGGVWTEGEVILANEASFLIIDDGDLKQLAANDADNTLWTLWSTDEGDIAEVRFADNGKLIGYTANGSQTWSSGSGNKGVHFMELTGICGIEFTNWTRARVKWAMGTAGCNTGAPTSALPAMPGLEVAFADLDDDGHNELLVMVENADGSGAIMYDPMGIVDLLTTYGFDVPQDFWSLLSPTQQAAMLAQLPPELNVGDTVEPAEAQQLTLEWQATAVVRPWDVIVYNATFDATGYETSTDTRIPATRMTLRIGDVHAEIDHDEFGTGFVLEASVAQIDYDVAGVARVTLQGPAVGGAMDIDRNGFTVGAGASVVGVAFTLGDEDGSYVGVNADVGVGFWAAASAGQNGQYGFAIQVPVIPVGVAVYVHGDDVEMAVDFAEGWALEGAAEVEELAPQVYGYARGWFMAHGGREAKVRFESGIDDTRVTVTRTIEGGEATVRLIVGDTSHAVETLLEAGDDIDGTLGVVADTLLDGVDAINATVTDWSNQTGQFAQDATGELIAGAKALYRKVKFW